MFEYIKNIFKTSFSMQSSEINVKLYNNTPKVLNRV